MRNKDVTALRRCAHLEQFDSVQIRTSHVPSAAIMFKSSIRVLQRSSKPRAIPIVQQSAFFHTTRKMSESSKVQEYKQAGNRENKPPKHEAVYFKGLMSEKRAFGDFRTVLHTGLYSQIVAMEVPVNGEIGDEVSFPCIYHPPTIPSWCYTIALSVSKRTC